MKADKLDAMLGGTTSAPTSLYSDDGRSTRKIEGEDFQPPKNVLGEKDQQPAVEPTSAATVNQSHLDQTKPDDIVKELLRVHREEAEERERAFKAAEDR